MEMRESEVKKEQCVSRYGQDERKGEENWMKGKEGKWKIMVLFRHEYCLNTAEVKEQEREFQKRFVQKVPMSKPKKKKKSKSKNVKLLEQEYY